MLNVDVKFIDSGFEENLILEDPYQFATETAAGKVAALSLSLRLAPSSNSLPSSQISSSNSLPSTSSQVSSSNSLPPTSSQVLLIGADTILYTKGQVVGKPKSRTQAQETLLNFSSNTVSCITGFVITLIDLKNPTVSIKSVKKNVETILHFNDISQLIEPYLSTNEWQGKAGGLAIQTLGECFVNKIEGSYSNVVGLPISDLTQSLVNDFQVSPRSL